MQYQRPTLFRRFIARLLILTLPITLLSPAGATGSIALPEIGDSSGSLLTPAQERRLGESFMRQVRAQMKVIDDPLANEYLQGLGRELVANSDAAGQPYTFFLIDDPEINAFAGPGGYIGINTGLILTTDSEAELASVLAHEITHVTQKHLLRTFDEASKMSIAAAGMILAAILIGAASKNTDVGIAAAAGVQAGLIQQQINFTRANEEEADRIGIQILADSGFDPTAMPVFFGRMGQTTRLYDNGRLPEFLRTHPITTNRIADAHARADGHPYRQRPDSLDYLLLRAALKERRFERPAEAITHFRTSLEEGRYRNETAQRYGYTRALLRALKLDEAERELNELLRADPLRVAYLTTQAELLVKRGRLDEAIGVLHDALELRPGSYPLIIAYADRLLEATRYPEARQMLEEQVRLYPEDARLYRMLSIAAGQGGDRNLGRQYQAEYLYLSGDLEAAIQQLELALDDRGLEYYRSAQMAARLKEIRRERADAEERKEQER